ncbi:MAG TPA: hypothetical protein VF181_07000 [Balneolaceae bacterium]
MNKTVKILLGIFTFLPLVVVIGSVVLTIYEILALVFSTEPVNPFLFIPYIAYVFPFILIFMAIYLLLGIFYLVHLLQNRQLDNEKKILWIAVLFAFNAFSMPAYWYIHVWSDESVQTEKKYQMDYDSSRTES